MMLGPRRRRELVAMARGLAEKTVLEEKVAIPVTESVLWRVVAPEAVIVPVWRSPETVIFVEETFVEETDVE